MSRHAYRLTVTMIAATAAVAACGGKAHTTSSANAGRSDTTAAPHTAPSGWSVRLSPGSTGRTLISAPSRAIVKCCGSGN